MTEDQANESRDDIRPLVARAADNRAVWIFGLGLFGAAGLLFYSLEARRAALNAPDEAIAANEDGGMISSPPPLAVPDVGADLGFAAEPGLLRQNQPAPLAPVRDRDPRRSAFVPPMPPPAPWQQQLPPQAMPPQTVPPAPAIVYSSDARSAPQNADPTATAKNERVVATKFQNPSSTVAKGTVIQAVLETALDSTRPGFARAIVSRDIFSFDGSQILIERGSRLIGEYKADLATGQKRALIQWQRLMRPDGVMIEIDSPAADPLGRAGVRGKVNSHFLERFGGAILQSSLDIGVQLATAQASRGVVIYGLPGDLRGAATPAVEKVQPTLTVRQGTGVSVFVARDLDFSTVGQ
jgi:type IV secretion system protein VirB10